MQVESICEFLEWDTQFFGRRIARVRNCRLTGADLVGVNRWCEDNRIDCLYFLADSSDPATSRLAEDDAFRLVDVRVTMEGFVAASTAAGNPGARIRAAIEQDIPGLRAIACASHRDSRFYFDGNFPSTLCDALYAAWIEKSCRGWAETVLVAEVEGRPAGYVSCHLSAPRGGKIGLVGIAEIARGRGLGKALVGEALAWFSGQGVEMVEVVTQGRNIRAQRLYQGCGFATKGVEIWFHKWFFRGPDSK